MDRWGKEEEKEGRTDRCNLESGSEERRGEVTER